MGDFQNSDMIPFDDAVELLVKHFRRRLEENPGLVLFHWHKRFDRRALLEFYDDDWVLLVSKPPTGPRPVR